MPRSSRRRSAGGGHRAQPELDRLSEILKTFNEHFGTLFDDADRIVQAHPDDIAPKVAADTATRTPGRTRRTPHAWRTTRR
jgi:type I restriction enzyme R subunit